MLITELPFPSLVIDYHPMPNRMAEASLNLVHIRLIEVT
jgi:hypothetical protein